MFVNPAVAVARIFTVAASGIMPVDAIAYALASVLGGIVAGLTWRYLWPNPDAEAA
jgi:glycerol uptake facilitator-like aquaporin